MIETLISRLTRYSVNYGEASQPVVESGRPTSKAVIHSIRPAKRNNPDTFDASRRCRIATGSGTSVQDVNRLLKQFREAQDTSMAMRLAPPRGAMPERFG